MHGLIVEVAAHRLQECVGLREQRGVGVGEFARAGTIPSRFLATMDRLRWARFPNSLARSALIRPMIASSL